MNSILIPIIYLVLLILPLSLFSKIYRSSNVKSSIDLISDSWFEPHIERSTYITLLQQADTEEIVLKCALIRRAVEDVKRIWKMRDDKVALVTLIQRGQIQAAEKELESEIVEVVSEANTFRMGWGQGIFQSASEIAQHDKIKSVHQTIA
ncbi:hypothetical protein E3P92_02675 [Wallemia ichthyophaga]|uniref:Translocation protein sec66 n=1 Tax=Wallemia ichthyophaga TaxID=245174 RepID=A0A4T0L6E0_WALIC|nr:hypothetical protein E3P91_02948 [Wallemia ichthyophaga]TIA80020.1 hypothetical protein E3P98_02941 [Wallemia ichthyophaga]TIA88980.1 hypothetical protein E3P97_03292 [Wallemia ichthyophaga]TIA96616.1 hypothetical protein E3P96_03568 [Wallemia ichthyophaga]TIA97828.1 hypothetical protein E3P94_03175 [Wallemia ichthyophaga]